MDTHYENYLETLEGKKLPVVHCQKGTLRLGALPGNSCF